LDWSKFEIQELLVLLELLLATVISIWLGSQGSLDVPVGNTAIDTELPTLDAAGVKAGLEELLFTPKKPLILSRLRDMCSCGMFQILRGRVQVS
jgi:hypothetical protein